MTQPTITLQTAARINKCLAALAVAAFALTGIAIFPSFAPEAAAAKIVSAPAPVFASNDPSCSTQNWPNFDPSCLRGTAPNGIKRVRLISTDKL